MVEGHQGSLICGPCLTLAYKALVLKQGDVVEATEEAIDDQADEAAADDAAQDEEPSAEEQAADFKDKWLRAMAEDVAMLGKKQHVQRDGGISAVPWKKTVQRQTVDLHL